MAALFIRGGGGGTERGITAKRGPTIPSSAGSNYVTDNQNYTMAADGNFTVMVSRPNRNTSDTVRVTVRISGVQVDQFTLPSGGNQYMINSYAVQNTNIVTVSLYSTGNCGPQCFVAGDSTDMF